MRVTRSFANGGAPGNTFNLAWAKISRQFIKDPLEGSRETAHSRQIRELRRIRRFGILNGHDLTVFQVSLLIKLEKLDWGSILDNKSDGHARRGRVGRNQYLFSGEFSGKIVHFEGDVRNITHKIWDRCFGFEAHPLDSVGAGFVSRHKGRVALDQAFSFPPLGSGNSDVMVAPRRTNR